MKKIPLWLAVVITLLTALPFLTGFYLGNVLFGFSLVPLDIFDWMVGIIPGGLLITGVGLMVDTLIALGSQDVDTAGKLIEQGMGYVFTLVGVAVVGLAIWGVVQRNARARVWGSVIGLGLGIVFLALSWFRPFANHSLLNVLWIVGLSVAWATVLTTLYLRSASPVTTPSATTAQPTPDTLNRREFLVQVGGTSAVLTLTGAGLGWLLDANGNPAPATQLATTVPTADGWKYVQGQRPELTALADFYRIDISTRPIEIDGAAWTLPFTGLVKQTKSFTLDELKAFPKREEIITLQCISNRIGGDLIGTLKWTGVPVRDVLAQLELEDNATHLRIEGGDQFFEYVSIEQIMADERIIFAYFFDDQPLPERNGFPLRIYLPDHYGMKQPKWIIGVEVVASDERGYWVRRGWSPTAQMQTTSVVDGVGTMEVYRGEADQLYLPIGGYAIAGARGISKIEVSVDEGEWQEATLKTPYSDLTWVYWRHDWAYQPGRHTFAVRCYEKDGTLQIVETRPNRPDGATGIHSVSRTLEDAPEVAGELTS
ncbi:MAG: molybdopterin-dependent oxidoreductase [Phototrophicaceae bacterium]